MSELPPVTVLANPYLFIYSVCIVVLLDKHTFSHFALFSGQVASQIHHSEIICYALQCYMPPETSSTRQFLNLVL